MRPSPNHGTQRLPNDDDDLIFYRVIKASSGAISLLGLHITPPNYIMSYALVLTVIGRNKART